MPRRLCHIGHTINGSLRRRTARVAVILDVFAKKTEATAQGVLTTCRRRLVQYQTVTQTRTRR